VATAADDSYDVRLVDAIGHEPNTFCIVPFNPDLSLPHTPCYEVDLDSASIAPLTAKAQRKPDPGEPESAPPLVSPDGKTRVVLPKHNTGPVKSFDVKTGRLLGSPKLDESAADMTVSLEHTRFIGDALFLVLYLDPSPYSEAHLFDPRTWREISNGKMVDVTGVREVHVDGTVWALVWNACGDGGEVAAPKVKWMDVATGSIEATTLELPWKECMVTPRVFEKSGRIGIVSPGAIGHIAIVDVKARTLVRHISLDECPRPKL
jgi:hypothetical protein